MSDLIKILSPNLFSTSWSRTKPLLNQFGLQMPDWFSNFLPMASVVIGIDVVQWTPFILAMAVYFLERTGDAPYEQAILEGATRHEIWRFFTLPSLRPVLGVVILLRIFDLLRIYDPIVILFGSGGPALRMETVSLYLHKLTFQPGNERYAALVALLYLCVLLLLLLASLRLPAVASIAPWNLRSR